MATNYVINEQIIPVLMVRKEVFKTLLEFVYDVNQPPEIKNRIFATELLVAADRYDFRRLKVYVESVLVDKFPTAKNAAALLIFVDSYSCALLKEAASNLFITKADIVKKSEAWSEVRESKKLLEELLDWVTSSRKLLGRNDDKRHSDFDTWDVTCLRERLEIVGLELDGSREILVKRLKKYHQDRVAKIRNSTYENSMTTLFHSNKG